MPVQPTKPELPSLKETPSKGIELNQRDAGELMRYILDLERGYKQ
ncbi:Rz-like spanin [Vibrio phage vB_VpaM_XM1]